MDPLDTAVLRNLFLAEQERQRQQNPFGGGFPCNESQHQQAELAALQQYQQYLAQQQQRQQQNTQFQQAYNNNPYASVMQQQQNQQAMNQQLMQSYLNQTNNDSMDVDNPTHPSLPSLNSFNANGSFNSFSANMSFNSLNANSIGSLGSLSRLFSFGALGSGANLNIGPSLSGPSFNNNRGFSQRRNNAESKERMKNETWSTLPTTNEKEPDSFAENGLLGPWSAASAALLGEMAITSSDKGKKTRKKPKNRPKRPLSAYNIFFKEERARILEELPGDDSMDPDDPQAKKKPHGKIGFQNLAKMVGKRWQGLEPKQIEIYKKKAEADMGRYRQEMVKFAASQEEMS